jgi:hypothetical protein
MADPFVFDMPPPSFPWYLYVIAYSPFVLGFGAIMLGGMVVAAKPPKRVRLAVAAGACGLVAIAVYIATQDW